MDKLRVVHLEILKEQLQNLEEVYVECLPAQQGISIMKIQDLSAGKMPSLSYPSVAMPKGRPSGAKNKLKNYTNRDLSAFKYATKKRRYGECGLIQGITTGVLFRCSNVKKRGSLGVSS